MKRKFLTSLLFTTLLISSCNGKTKNYEIGTDHKIKKTENVENDFVRISYNQKINGYKVNVLWKPKTLRYDKAIGPAILEFKNEEYEFTLTNNYFALPTKLVGLKTNDDSIIGIKNKNVSLDYKEPNLKNTTFESIEVPFVFLDLNFDDNKELMITKSFQGQRFGNAFDAYSFDEYGELEPEFYQITDKEPYNQIDFFTKLDKDKKELILYGSGGICFSSYYTYSLVDNNFDLTKIVREERDDEAEKCYVLTYSVKNGVEKLISRVEVEQ